MQRTMQFLWKSYHQLSLSCLLSCSRAPWHFIEPRTQTSNFFNMHLALSLVLLPTPTPPPPHTHLYSGVVLSKLSMKVHMPITLYQPLACILTFIQRDFYLPHSDTNESHLWLSKSTQMSSLCTQYCSQSVFTQKTHHLHLVLGKRWWPDLFFSPSQCFNAWLECLHRAHILA